VSPRTTEIEDIAQSIWMTLFEVPLERGGADAIDSESTVTCIVHIDGAWHGAVVLRCPVELARTLTSEMFRSESEPSFDEVKDALGEVTNMLAGNLKALLPEPSEISLPAVARGSNYEFGVVGTNVVATVPFMCAGQPLVVLLVQRSGDNGAER